MGSRLFFTFTCLLATYKLLFTKKFVNNYEITCMLMPYEKLKKSINTTKDKADILLNLGNNSVIIIECKTVKESGKIQRIN